MLLVLLPARDAQAYLDPGTGSMIIQIVVASVLGALFTLKLWFGVVKRFVRRLTGAEAKAMVGASRGEAVDAGSKPTDNP